MQNLSSSPPAAEHIWRVQDASWAVQLWQRRNWHWYQLIERRWTASGPMHIMWSEASSQSLLVLSCHGRLERWGLAMAADVSDRGTAAVAEGATTLLTPFRHAVIPPPLCAARVIAPSPVRALAWGESSGCECLALVHVAGVCVAWSVEEDLWEETVEEAAEEAGGVAEEDALNDGGSIDAAQLQLPAELAAHSAGIHACTHVCWMTGDTLALVIPAPWHAYGSGVDAIVSLTLQWPEGIVVSGAPAVSAYSSCCVGSVVTSAIASGNGAMLVQTATGALLRVSMHQETLQVSPAGQFPEPCRDVFVQKLQGTDATAGTGTIFGLSAAGKLFAGDAVIATDVTSAGIRHRGPGGAYLLFTTNSQILYTSPLSDGVLPLPTVGTATPATQPAADARDKGAMAAAMRPAAAQLQPSSIAARAIEAGARLVACPADSALVVLQMPRGNLEGVHVRMLTLASVADQLLQRDFCGAVAEALAQRVDLNLLVDFCWPVFLEQSGEFVRQVAPGDVCDVLAALRPDNCLAEGERYNGALPAGMQEAHDTAAQQTRGPAANAAADGGHTDKVNRVCAAVREHALLMGGGHERTAVMSYVRCGSRPGTTFSLCFLHGGF